MVAADTEQVTGNTRSNDNGGGGGFPFQSLGRQSSIYSLTLDEFQNTMCESGKNFGSMNMDEFLNSIWTAEENQNQNDAVSTIAHTNPRSAPVPAGRGLGLAKQPSLARQGSLTLPAPLCRKTVEEVWSEIQRGGHGGRSGQSQSSGPSAQQRQQTFGEMTLEDFLIKAGVVRDAGLGHQQQPQPPQYGSNPQTYGPTAMTVPGGFPALPQNGGGGGGESSAYVAPGPGDSKRNNGYVPVGPTGTVCYGGGYGMASPVSPLGPEGRKRTLDGPVEKVVERRQRRMIKNRESAARSRARKQAYTVELEAELNQLREENSQLKQALDELERQRNQQQQYVEEQQNVPQSRADDRLRLVQRSKSCPL